MATSNAFIYDPRYHTFESWACLMCEQYAAQNLSIPTATTDWQEWGQGLLAIDIFTNEAAPNPVQFGDWQEWASALLGSINLGMPA